MKSTGVCRSLDNLGRLVLPMEIRKSFGIDPGDLLEISVDDSNIILKKKEPYCVFCGNSEKVIAFREKSICKDCIDTLMTHFSKR